MISMDDKKFIDKLEQLILEASSRYSDLHDKNAFFFSGKEEAFTEVLEIFKKDFMESKG